MKFITPDEYLPETEKAYNDLKKHIAAALPEAEVEQIGSSAIRGAISKGDLDVLVRVRADAFEFSINAIQKLGFNIKQGTLRTASLCMLETANYPIDVAIQLIVSGSEFEFFVKFRNAVNEDPDLAEKYNQLKRNAESMPASDYRALKSAFIESVLKGSR